MFHCSPEIKNWWNSWYCYWLFFGHVYWLGRIQVFEDICVKFRGMMEPQIELKPTTADQWALGQTSIVPLVRTLAGDPILLIWACAVQCAYPECVCASVALSAKTLGSTLIFQFSTVSPFCPQSSFNSPFSTYSFSFGRATFSILSVYVLHQIQTNTVTPYAYVSTSVTLLLPV